MLLTELEVVITKANYNKLIVNLMLVYSNNYYFSDNCYVLKNAPNELLLINLLADIEHKWY